MQRLQFSLSPSPSFTHTRSHSHSLSTHTHIHTHTHSHSLTFTHSPPPRSPPSSPTITSLDPNASRSLDFLLIDLIHTVWGLLPSLQLLHKINIYNLHYYVSEYKPNRTLTDFSEERGSCLFGRGHLPIASEVDPGPAIASARI